MKEKIIKYCEPALFYSFVGFNVWIVLHFTFLGGSDGPSHLYYSRVVNYILGGNSFLRQYFVINHLPVPNLTDHYLLALFDVFFRSSISEKLLLLIFVAGFPVAFRLIIQKYNPAGIAASSFIIPFTHSAFLYMGAYNFCISFTFLFWAVFYYVKNFSSTDRLYSPAKYFIFSALVLLNYFTNGISFLFLGLICTLAELFWFIPIIKAKKLDRLYALRRCILFCMFWIPELVMLYIFNSSMQGMHHAIGIRIPFIELLKWFYDFRCLSYYQLLSMPNSDGVYTHLIFFWLAGSVALAIYLRRKDKKSKKKLFADIFLVVFIITAMAYFIIPQSAGVGIISDRLFYYLIIFLILWIALQKSISKVALPLAAILLTIHVFFFFNKHFRPLSDLNNDALNLQKASAFIEPNSVVSRLHTQISPIETSISNILGIDKPLVILEWYEPDYGWFAVNRTIGKLPELLVNAYPPYTDYYIWIDNRTKKLIAVVDYILFYGDNYLINPDQLKLLRNSYNEIFSSPDNKLHLFHIKHKIEGVVDTYYYIGGIHGYYASLYLDTIKMITDTAIKKHYYGLAAHEFTHATQSFPNSAYVYGNLGNCYSNMGYSDSAISAYKKSLAIDSNSQISNTLGVLYYNKAQYDTALSYFLISYKTDSNIIAIMDIGLSYQNKKKYEEAIHYDSLFLKKSPGNARALTNIALIHNEKGAQYLNSNKLDEAMKEFILALQYDPNLSSAIGNMGFIYQKKGQLEKARSCYEKALLKDPKNEIFVKNLQGLNASNKK